LKHGDCPLPRRIDSDSTHGAIDEAMSDDRSPPRSLDQNLTGKDKNSSHNRDRTVGNLNISDQYIY